jgi:hypothetical protein
MNSNNDRAIKTSKNSFNAQVAEASMMIEELTALDSTNQLKQINAVLDSADAALERMMALLEK